MLPQELTFIVLEETLADRKKILGVWSRLQSAFHLISKMFDGIMIGVLAGESNSSTLLSSDQFCINVALCTGTLSCKNKKKMVHLRTFAIMWAV